MAAPSEKLRGYRLLKNIFQSAIELPPEKRAAFLDEKCGEDEVLRGEIEQLLASYDSRFMEEPAVAQVAEEISGSDAENEPTEIVSADQSGKQFGHYRIISKIGHGGMGEIYLAHDLNLDRRVALKLLPPQFTHDKERLQRLEQEARAVSALNHPYILTIYEFGETDDGTHFIASEFVEGRTLDKFRAGDFQKLSEKLEVVIKIASALDAAHRAGIIHRDIKPENIIVRPDGHIKVLDFGLAKLTEQYRALKADSEVITRPIVKTHSGLIIGTAPYMSPEQARGKKVDPRTDIWSLGVVLYELIGGRNPFSGETIADTIVAIMEKEPAPFSTSDADLPAGLEKVVRRMLCKEPDQRFQTALEVQTALEQIKKRLDFESEFRRIGRPEKRNKKKERRAVPSERRTKQISKKRDTGKKTPRPTLSAEYIVDRIRTHKAMALVALAAFLLAAAGLAYRVTKPAAYEPVPEALMWFEKGHAAFDDGLLLVAKSSFEKAIEKDGNYAIAHAALAETYDELGYTEEAETIRTRANEIERTNERPLSYQDSLRLQAINKTLLADFPGAIEPYRQLTEYVPPTDRARAFLDLGKAFERNEDLPEAIQSYQKALDLDSGLASASLRLGALYGRQQKYQEAESHLSKAENLYKTQQNFEGEIEAINQRGLMLSGRGDAEEAFEKVKISLSKARVNETPYQQIKSLNLISRILRSLSRPKDALPYAEEAVVVARREGFSNLLAESLKELGTVHFFLTDHQQAEKLYGEALELARQVGVELIEKRILLQFAAFYIQQHKADEALAYIDRVEGFFEKGGYRKDMLDVLSIKGRALDVKGDFKASLALYRDLDARAERVGDLVIRARAKKGIGTASANLDELGAAAPALYESYSIYNSINRTLEAAYSLMAHADVSLQLGDYQKAYSSLNLAEGIAEEQTWLGPRTALLRAKLALSQRKFAEAIATAEKDFADDAGKRLASPFESKPLLALAYTYQGQKQRGRKMIEQLLAEAPADDDLQMIAGAHLAHAEIMLENDLPEKAIESARKTREILKKLGKPSLEWRAWLLESLAQRRLGDVRAAKHAAAKADEIYSTLLAKWGPENFKSYSARPDIQHYRQQLADLFTG